jgi:hypothetical protein
MTHREGIELILKEFPKFKTIWDELEKDSILFPDLPRGSTTDFGEFARFVQQEYVKPNDEEMLAKIGEMIELFIEKGDEDLSYGATMGFLEDVTNVSDPDIKIENLMKHLGPKAQSFCKDLEKSWGTPIPGLE